MHRALCRFMPLCGITETLSDVESVRVVHMPLYFLEIHERTVDMTNITKVLAPHRGNKSVAISKNLASKIPFIRCYEEEGIIETTPGNFSKTYIIGEIDMDQIEKTSSASARQVMEQLMNSFPDNVSFEFTTYNRLIDQDSYLKQILIFPDKDEVLNEYIKEYDQVIVDNVSIGHNNIKKTCFFTVAVRTSLVDDAVEVFHELNNQIKESFDHYYGVGIKSISVIERLRLIYSIFNPDCNDFGKIIDLDGSGSIDLNNLKYMHVTTKDLVAPKRINHSPTLKDYMIIASNSGEQIYSRSFAIVNVPRQVSDNVISDLTNVSGSMIFSSIYEYIDTNLGYETVKEAVIRNTVTKDIYKRDSVADRKAHTKIQHKEQIYHSEKDYFNNTALEVFQKNVAGSKKTQAVTLVVTIFGNSLEDIERDSALLKISADKFGFKLKALDFQQLEGLQTSLPLCTPRIDYRRIIDLQRLVTICPVSVQDVIRRGGMYNGLNAINDNLILLNRKNNKNLCGIIAGVDHSGKTYQCKKEIFNALISTDDDIAVITDTDEYDEFAHKLGGIIVTHMDVAIMQMAKGYAFQDREGNEEKDLVFKSFFLDAFFMSLMDTHEAKAFQPKIEAEVTEAIRSLDNEEFKHQERKCSYSTVCKLIKGNSGKYPTLNSLISRVKTPFIGGGNPTSASRLTIYKVKDRTDILVLLDYLRNKTVLDLAGSDQKKSSQNWIFIDPVDVLLEEQASADYLSEYMYKSDIVQTVLTFVLQDSVRLINSQITIMAFEDMVRNAGYFKLLNQGPVERHKFTELLDIPQALVPYISNVEPGKGIIITSSSNMAFDDSFIDKDSKYHQLFAKEIQQIMIDDKL